MGVIKPEALSMLSCYHLGNSHVMSSMEAAGLHLKLAEGFGLSAADVAKVTKILLLALTSMDVLAKMCAVFSMLLALTLGEKAPAMTAFLEQCNDFWDNEESYDASRSGRNLPTASGRIPGSMLPTLPEQLCPCHDSQ